MFWCYGEREWDQWVSVWFPFHSEVSGVYSSGLRFKKIQESQLISYPFSSLSNVAELWVMEKIVDRYESNRLLITVYHIK